MEASGWNGLQNRHHNSRSLYHKASKRQRAAVPALQRYDEETGQIYVETTYKARKRSAPWFRQTLGSVDSVPSGSENGAASLKAMASAVLLKNLDCLETESLQGVDWAMGKKLLQSIDDHGLKSFEVWRIFITRYFKQKPDNYERHLSDEHYELDVVIKDLTKFSTGSPFLVFLTIYDCLLPAQTYVQLGDLPNLAVLKLWETGRSDTPASFNERVLRTWRESATEGSSFRKLRAVEVTDMGLSSPTILSCFENHRNLTLVRILPGDRNTAKVRSIGTWSRMCLPSNEQCRTRRLLSGEVVPHEVLLSFALEAAALAPSTLPHCSIGYGRNDSTRYYRERPMSGEVWVRNSTQKQRLPPTGTNSVPMFSSQGMRTSKKGTSLESMLSSFTNR